MPGEKTRAPDRDPGQPLTGWIQWGGGPCPVGPRVEVQITCRDGYTITGAAGDFTAPANDGIDWWVHSEERRSSMPGGDQSDDDIVRYRLVAA